MDTSVRSDDPIARLQRELQHVTAQAQVAHAMAMDWKARCLQAEQQRDRLQKKLDRVRRRLMLAKGRAKPTRATDPGDAVLEWLLTQEMESDEPDLSDRSGVSPEPQPG